MLNALANHLRLLADSESDNFRQLVKDRLNGKVTDDQIGVLKEFIFLLPPALKQLEGYWRDKSTPAEAKKLSGYIISYIYNPHNFIPEDKFGLFGYLDDSYIVVSAFLHIEDLYLRDWQKKSRAEMELANRARSLMMAPRLVIPEITEKIDKIVSSLMKGEISGFEEVFNNGNH